VKADAHFTFPLRVEGWVDLGNISETRTDRGKVTMEGL